MSGSEALTFSSFWIPETGQTKFRINGGGPKERICDELFDQINLGGSPYGDITDGVLTLRDDFGRKLIYVLGDYDPVLCVHELRWPD